MATRMTKKTHTARGPVGGSAKHAVPNATVVVRPRERAWRETLSITAKI